MSNDRAKPAVGRRLLAILDVLRSDVDGAFCDLSCDTRSGAARRHALGAAIDYLDAARAGVERVESYPEARLAVEQTMPMRVEPSSTGQGVRRRRGLSWAKNWPISEAVEFDEFLHDVLAAEPFRWDFAIWNAFQRAARALYLDPADFSPSREIADAMSAVCTARARLMNPRLASDLEVKARELAGAVDAVGWAHAKAHRVLLLATTHPASRSRRSGPDYWLAPLRR
ncbi:hypothetical protein LMG22931_05543 [Paraburkholderia nemoris]|nr:hypothetical protein LMG22931_05543 [Paraburkholderia nemoris]